MTSAPAAQFAAAPAPAAMGIYERRHPPLAAGVWGDPFLLRQHDAGTSNGAMAMQAAAASLPAAAPPPATLAEPKFESQVVALPLQPVDKDDALLQEGQRLSPDSFEHEPSRPRDKIQRRLAQNREAARKSRLRKKAYIQNLETSRMKLAHLEHEITRARQQGVYINSSSKHSSLPSPIDSGVAAFELEYAHWVDEQKKQTEDLRAAIHSGASDTHLQILVESGLDHYDKLFKSKSAAAKRDVFFVMSGVWRTPAERFFLWISGFRPSDVLAVVAPCLQEDAAAVDERQAAEVEGLRQKARHLEDALSQGMEKLKQTLADSILADAVLASGDGDGDESPPDSFSGGGGGGGDGGYMARMGSAVGRLNTLVDFIDHADHLRLETLQNMYRILGPRQAARGLLALGDYCQRLRALSSLWAARPREPA
uniref:DOG1 domain-containing protein n=1 Tax=Leersia perrieri TaxID=77586 RepID=A0A0D9X4Y5_9ORYZ